MLRLSLIFSMLVIVNARAANLSRGPYAKRLADECDALIQEAIRRPYGWGWTHDAAIEPSGKPTPRAVQMDPLCTPAAGLMLLWAGDELREPRYAQAAEQAARAIAICQKSNGRVPSDPVFSRAPLVNEEHAVVADRSATCCALGLMLGLIDESGGSASGLDDLAHRSAARCSEWLRRQLTPSNFWPSAFPPDAPATATERIVRFDDGDSRDSSIALLLSAKMLGIESLQPPAANSVAALLKVILKSDVHGPNLWNTAVTIDAAGVPRGFPRGADVLASRMNMQTLLASYLLSGERDDGLALDAAANTLRQSHRADGMFDRFLDPTAEADAMRAQPPPATTQSVFAQPTSRSTETPFTTAFTSGTFGIPPVLEATARLKELGRDRYVTMISATFSLQQQLEATLCGLDDDPMSPILPASAEEVTAWLSANEERMKLLDGPPVADLAGKVQRLWLLLIRTKLERLFPAAS